MRSVIESVRGESHTEGARAALIVAKANFAQGDIQGTQEFIKKSLVILKRALAMDKTAAKN